MSSPKSGLGLVLLDEKHFFIHQWYPTRRIMRKKASKKLIACYCAFCRSPRRIYRAGSIGFSTVIFCLLLALPVSYALWNAINPAVLFVFVLLLAISEGVLQLRRRLSMICKQCGFDPLLYSRSPASACERVKAHLEKRKLDPMTLFSPVLNLPTVRRSAQLKKMAPVPRSAESRSGSLLSKRT